MLEDDWWIKYVCIDGTFSGGEESEEGDSPANAATGDISQMTAVDELREIVRFLRRDKDILECKLKLSEQETNRVRQRSIHLEKSLQEARAKLQEEMEKTQGLVEQEAIHRLVVLSDYDFIVRPLPTVRNVFDAGKRLKSLSNSRY